ncbi:hypothetical protein AAG570_007021 [Ranatra chinensis]|uniref:Uncharacterized protein n=1 Tax=Ranatra chinensis TaxID=642074 RepID=A0ABD0YXW7_9HEMI
MGCTSRPYRVVVAGNGGGGVSPRVGVWTVGAVGVMVGSMVGRRSVTGGGVSEDSVGDIDGGSGVAALELSSLVGGYSLGYAESAYPGREECLRYIFYCGVAQENLSTIEIQALTQAVMSLFIAGQQCLLVTYFLVARALGDPVVFGGGLPECSCVATSVAQLVLPQLPRYDALLGRLCLRDGFQGVGESEFLNSRQGIRNGIVRPGQEPYVRRELTDFGTVVPRVAAGSGGLLDKWQVAPCRRCYCRSVRDRDLEKKINGSQAPLMSCLRTAPTPTYEASQCKDRSSSMFGCPSASLQEALQLFYGGGFREVHDGFDSPCGWSDSRVVDLVTEKSNLASSEVTFITVDADPVPVQAREYFLKMTPVLFRRAGGD